MEQVYIGLELDKLVELMQKGMICGADIHALNPEAKELVRQACLKSCVKKMCSGCEMSDICGVKEERDAPFFHSIAIPLSRH